MGTLFFGFLRIFTILDSLKVSVKVDWFEFDNLSYAFLLFTNPLTKHHNDKDENDSTKYRPSVDNYSCEFYRFLLLQIWRHYLFIIILLNLLILLIRYSINDVLFSLDSFSLVISCFLFRSLSFTVITIIICNDCFIFSLLITFRSLFLQLISRIFVNFYCVRLINNCTRLSNDCICLINDCVRLINDCICLIIDCICLIIDCFCLIIDCFCLIIDCFCPIIDCFCPIIDCFCPINGCFCLVNGCFWFVNDCVRLINDYVRLINDCFRIIINNFCLVLSVCWDFLVVNNFWLFWFFSWRNIALALAAKIVSDKAEACDSVVSAVAIDTDSRCLLPVKRERCILVCGCRAETARFVTYSDGKTKDGVTADV